MTPAELLVAKPEAFEEANRKALEAAEALVEKLKSSPAPRATPATVAAYDDAMAALSDASSRASVARNAHPDAAMRDVAERCEQQVDALATRFSLDRGIYDALRELDPQGEDPATRFYLHRTLRDFRRAGVDRDEETRKRVQALNEELVRIGQEFSRNIREDVR
ncbi:MAG TPA: peptidase M3, partial [Myxococcales bacterium]|nr:peptidase M3 [Myxococcales bacterium]